MAVWTTLSYSALEVLSATKLNQNQANFTALIESAASSPIATLGLTVAPGSALTGQTIDQDYNALALSIDSEATTAGVILITAQLTGGQGIQFTNSGAQTGGAGLVRFNQNNASTTDFVLRLDHAGDGTTLDINSSATSATVLDLTAANTSGNVVSIVNSAAQTAGALVKLNLSNAGSDKPCLEIDNDGSGEEIKFTNAVTRTLTVSSFSFRGDILFPNWKVGRNGIINADGAFGSETYYAGFCLPDGAIITSVEYHIYRDDAVASIGARVRRTSHGGALTEISAMGADAATGYQTVAEAAAPINNTIDLSTYSYHCDVTMDNNDNILDTALIAIEIIYTIAEPLP